MTHVRQGRGRRPVAVVVALVVTLASTAAADGAGLDWRRVEHRSLDGGVSISYVMDVLPPLGASGWLAAGFVVDPDGLRSPSIWTSRDGAGWHRVVLPASPSSERRDGVYRVARRGNVIVALGERFQNGLRNAAWRSDGSGWSALTDESDALLSFQGRITGLTASSSGFVAVGVVQFSGGSLVQVFASPDGRAWSIEGVLPTPDGEQVVPTSVLVVGERLFVTGESILGDGRSEGRIWVSSGRDWVRVDPRASGMAGPGRTQVAAIAYAPRVGFVAGGLVRPGAAELPAAWFSRDGSTWARLPKGAVPTAAGGAAIHEMAFAAGHFLAAGNTASGPVLWRSADGRRWTPLDGPKKPYTANWANVTMASAGGVTVVALAGDGAADAYRRGRNGHWSAIDRAPAFPGAAGGAAELRDVAAAGGRLVAIGQDAHGRPLVLTSRDARSWTRAAIPDSRARLLGVAASHGVFAIAGWRLVRGAAHPALWTSTTGRAWRRLGGEALDPVGALVDISPDGPRFAIAGFEGSAHGLQASVWSGGLRTLEPKAVLGPGEARAICVGPHGATVVATRGEGREEHVVAWRRSGGRPWSRDPDIVATGAAASGCADGPSGTLVVGAGATDGSAVAWTTSPASPSWRPTVLANTGPPSGLFGVARSGNGFVTAGQTGSRGQVDLAIWSSDGRNWRSVGGGAPIFAEPGYQAGLAIVPFGDGVVVVGRRGSGNGAIWVGHDPAGSSPS